MPLGNRNIFTFNVCKWLKIALLFLITLLGSQAEEHLIIGSVSSLHSHFTSTNDTCNTQNMPSCGIYSSKQGTTTNSIQDRRLNDKGFTCCFLKSVIFPMSCKRKLTWTPPYSWGNREGHVRRQINWQSRTVVAPETEPRSPKSHTSVIFTRVSCCSANRSSYPYCRRKFPLLLPEAKIYMKRQRWHQDNLSGICKYKENILLSEKK